MSKRIKSCYVGSLPFEEDFSRFLEDQEYFQQKIFKSFPTYECALTYLQHVAKAVKTFEKSEF
jgi:hypothetical protein